MINQDQGESQISKHYFEKCEELAFIEQPFHLSQAKQQLQRRDFQSQFDLIRALTQTKKHRARLRINDVLQNKRNRYPEQSIYQHSRIKLAQKESQQQGYINANFVPLSPQKKIIITQGPLQSTQLDFETMLRQEKITCVIMVCNLVQNKKPRCCDYLTNRNKKNILQIEDYISVNQVQLKAEQQQSSWVYTHIHYTLWPDKELPASYLHLNQVFQLSEKHNNICIQCSAGLGRSGVMGCILFLQERISRGQEVSVFGTVRRMREYRFGAVQNSSQYRFLYQYLCWLAEQQQ